MKERICSFRSRCFLSRVTFYWKCFCHPGKKTENHKKLFHFVKMMEKYQGIQKQLKLAFHNKHFLGLFFLLVIPQCTECVFSRFCPPITKELKNTHNLGYDSQQEITLNFFLLLNDENSKICHWCNKNRTFNCELNATFKAVISAKCEHSRCFLHLLQ